LWVVFDQFYKLFKGTSPFALELLRRNNFGMVEATRHKTFFNLFAFELRFSNLGMAEATRSGNTSIPMVKLYYVTT